MNIFGVEISFNGKRGKYVKYEHCHDAQDKIRNEIKDRVDEMKSHFDTRFSDLGIRFDDFKDFLLNNSK